MTPTPRDAPSVAWRTARRRRQALLALAAVWTVVVTVVVWRYHIDEPKGELGVTINGVTYSGNPPALTLRERDATAAMLLVVVPSAGVVVGVLESLVRSRDERPGIGVAAVTAGGCVIVFSLFGLLWGLASLGVVGALVLASGLVGYPSLVTPSPGATGTPT